MKLEEAQKIADEIRNGGNVKNYTLETLSEVINLLVLTKEKHDCVTCKHEDLPAGSGICYRCTIPGWDNWEPKTDNCYDCIHEDLEAHSYPCKFCKVQSGYSHEGSYFKPKEPKPQHEQIKPTIIETGKTISTTNTKSNL